MNNEEWKQRSLAHVWQPCTQMRDHAGPEPALPLIPIKSAEGVWLEDFDGKRYLDAVSSWWTNIFRSEEHTSELQSLMRNSYAVFCLKKKHNDYKITLSITTTKN